MNIKKILSENLSVAFFALCSTILAESAFLRLFGNENPLFVGITSVVFMSVTVFLYLNRKNSAAYVGAAAVITIIILALNIAGINIFKLAATAFSALPSEKLGIAEALLVTAVISALLSAILLPTMKAKSARLASAVLAVALLVFYGFNNIAAAPVETFSAAGIILAELSELCVTRLYKKEPQENITPVISFLLPVFAVFSITAAIIPSSPEPISWDFVKNIAAGTVSFFENIAAEISFAVNPSSSEFGISMQGYSDASGIFGAGISSENSEQLTLTAYIRPRASVYLIGNANDTYTGDGWTKSDRPDFSETDYYLDYCEMIYAFERAGYTHEDLLNFTSTSDLIIKYKSIITKTLFYPLKTSKISCTESYNATSPSVVFDSKATDGTSYTVKYLEINYYSDEFMNVARNAFDYDSAEANPHYLDTKIPDNIVEKLSLRAENIRNSYTSLPDCITQRTYDLAASITAGCITDYDKLRAIELYLRSNYTYTTTPGGIPDGSDPVDYFLFDSKEGYCTYFASAMAILTRCAGIPSRYVQGFSVSAEPNESFTDLVVSGSDAHAWAEAYIEGIGWIPFEATAAYFNSRYAFRGRPQNNASNFDHSMNDYYGETEATPNNPLELDNTNSDISAYIAIASFTLLGVVLIIALYIAIKVRGFIKSYNAATDTERFMSCFRMIIFLFAKNKLTRLEGETANYFAKRVSYRYAETEVSFIEITEAFDEIRYGGSEATQTQREAIEIYVRMMFDEIKQKRGKFGELSTFISYCLK